MTNSISEDLKKILLAGVGAVAMTAEKSKELINELVKKGELTVEQGKVLNEELKHNIKEKVKETVSKNMDAKTIAENLDKMSKEDLELLKAKLAQMEKAEPDGDEEGK